MINNFILIGRIKSINENSLTIITTRNFKNENGEYEHDVSNIVVSENTLSKVIYFCK